MLSLVVAAVPAAEHRRCRALGFVGSSCVALGGLAAGALPVRATLTPVRDLGDLRGYATLGLACTYFGLALLVLAWWWLGTIRPPARGLLVTFAVWAGPLVLGPPLFSRDVYSYLAQGQMVGAHIDVYQYGPAALGGNLAAQVPAIWQTTPTPYGPVFLALATRVARLADGHVAGGVLGMRAIALLGVVLLAACLPRLARACGVDPSPAVWLGLLNPLVLLHLVAGAHNDAVMLGLLVAGLVLALDRRPALGAVLVTLAALVKAPAALGLLVVAAIWAGQFAGRWRWPRALGAAGATGLATTVLATGVAGTGYGWIAALSTPISATNWSVTSALGRLTGLVLDTHLGVSAWRWIGLGAVGAIGVVVWLRREQLGVVHALGLCLAATAVLGPALRTWYLLWGLVPIAAAAPAGAVRRWAAAASGLLALAVLPDGFGPDPQRLAVSLAGGAVALVAVWWWATGTDLAVGPRLDAVGYRLW
ncbi:polyprenol phosphomannose-dependent alpha 1,6 mannosyltransferase MptB [Longispora sp. NPDC051575]|uniref:polyprenol phosphomannose-dependent alpha 1,6 mannosyltransferase MptB n=1 Tax=Longispora sp. NPDC051575 TaxID=3154943 RepID=UPI0034434548